MSKNDSTQPVILIELEDIFKSSGEKLYFVYFSKPPVPTSDHKNAYIFDTKNNSICENSLGEKEWAIKTNVRDVNVYLRILDKTIVLLIDIIDPTDLLNGRKLDKTPCIYFTDPLEISSALTLLKEFNSEQISYDEFYQAIVKFLAKYD